jgi:hypothetical protein
VQKIRSLLIQVHRDTMLTDTDAQNTSMLVAYHRINESKNSDKRILV